MPSHTAHSTRTEKSLKAKTHVGVSAHNRPIENKQRTKPVEPEAFENVGARFTDQDAYTQDYWDEGVKQIMQPTYDALEGMGMPRRQEDCLKAMISSAIEQVRTFITHPESEIRPSASTLPRADA